MSHIEQVDRGARTARYWFNSQSELQRYIEAAPKTWIGATSSKTNRASDSWDLKAGYEGALRMARDGWMEGAERAQEALKAFTPTSPAPDIRNDFYGHMPHVPRYCAGAPDNMIRHVPNPRAGMGRVLTLIVPINALAEVHAKYMANFGVGMAQYINQMETQGIRCEVIGILVSEVSEWRVSHSWRVKGADQPLDLAVMAFSIGHPAMFRRLGFALRERCAAPRDYSYGHSESAQLSDLIDAPSGAYIVNGMRFANTVARTPQAAYGYIEKQIEKAMEDREHDGTGEG